MSYIPCEPSCGNESEEISALPMAGWQVAGVACNLHDPRARFWVVSYWAFCEG